MPFAIVIAEDNSADVWLVREALKEHEVNCTLHVLQDGKQTLAFLDKADREPSAGKMDLLVLDLNLPKHSPEEILQKLRSTQHLADTPVILMTAPDGAAPQLKRAAKLASACFPKPSTLDGFLRIGSVVRGLLEERTGQAALGNGKATAGAL